MSPYSHKGFTLLEILIVLGLMSMIALFGVAMSYSSISRSSVLQERDLFVSLLLSGARAQALANIHEVSHGIRIDNTLHQYILFEGDAYDDFPASHRSTAYTNENITITNTGGNDIVFEQLSGNVLSGAGTITVSDNHATQKIFINEVGQINW